LTAQSRLTKYREYTALDDSTLKEYTAEAGRERVDSYLARVEPELSRSRLKKLIESGLVTVDGKPVRASRKLAEGELVRVEVPAPEVAEALPEDIPLEILFEDQYLIAVSKPRGMVVHPAPGHSSGTLVNALLGHVTDLSGIGGVLRPGIVHRLDKDTSGVILVAKDDRTHQELQALFKMRQMNKTYLAVVLGKMVGEGTVDLPIGRHPTDRKKMAAGDVNHSRTAVSHWRALAELQGAALVEVEIETGRTHQIRVHLASMGNPVAGDPLYGGQKRAKGIADHRSRKILTKAPPQALHAWKLNFIHPHTGEELNLKAPLPEEMEALIVKLGLEESALQSLLQER
jgi:23S rRNA pseudouridine1911/1915/1917 synthase